MCSIADIFIWSIWNIKYYFDLYLTVIKIWYIICIKVLQKCSTFCLWRVHKQPNSLEITNLWRRKWRPTCVYWLSSVQHEAKKHNFCYWIFNRCIKDFTRPIMYFIMHNTLYQLARWTLASRQSCYNLV